MIGSRARSARRSVILGGAILSLALLLPARARADFVPPPPTDCPEGTMGATCHGPQYCQPNTCKTNTDCGPGEVCEPRSICLGQVVCFGGIVGPDGGPSTFPQPAGGTPCSTSADCDGGATCTMQSLCITPGSSSASTGTGTSTGTGSGAGGSSSGGTVIHSGCSCEAVGGNRPVALYVLLAAGSASAVARLRRRRARR